MYACTTKAQTDLDENYNGYDLILIEGRSLLFPQFSYKHVSGDSLVLYDCIDNNNNKDI